MPTIIGCAPGGATRHGDGYRATSPHCRCIREFHGKCYFSTNLEWIYFKLVHNVCEDMLTSSIYRPTGCAPGGATFHMSRPVSRPYSRTCYEQPLLWEANLLWEATWPFFKMTFFRPIQMYLLRAATGLRLNMLNAIFMSSYFADLFYDN